MVRVCCVLSLSSIVCVRWKKKENFQPTNKKLNKLQCYLAAAKGSFVFLLLQIRWRKNFRFVSEQKFSTFFFKLKVRSSFFAASSCERANFFLLHLSASSSIKSSSSSSSSGFAASWNAHKNKKNYLIDALTHTTRAAHNEKNPPDQSIRCQQAKKVSAASKHFLSVLCLRQWIEKKSLEKKDENKMQLRKKKLKILWLKNFVNFSEVCWAEIQNSRHTQNVVVVLLVVVMANLLVFARFYSNWISRAMEKNYKQLKKAKKIRSRRRKKALTINHHYHCSSFVVVVVVAQSQDKASKQMLLLMMMMVAIEH